MFHSFGEGLLVGGTNNHNAMWILQAEVPRCPPCRHHGRHAAGLASRPKGRYDSPPCFPTASAMARHVPDHPSLRRLACRPLANPLVAISLTVGLTQKQAALSETNTALRCNFQDFEGGS